MSIGARGGGRRNEPFARNRSNTTAPAVGNQSEDDFLGRAEPLLGDRLGFAQFKASRTNSVFERRALVVEEKKQPARFQRISDTKKGFELIKRLDQELGCADRQGAPLSFFVYIGSQHNDRQKNVRWIGAKRLKNSKAVDVRHHQIEQDQIGIEDAAGLKGAAGVGDGFESCVAGIRQHFLEQSDIGRFVVDDENFHLG
jgi:hypothetical protein